ncbi:hypothetical protein [Sulfitobacter pontiacus]|uniref:hypothetical protein n=1 Tax=Sulfitobacter pontiacus TaxID=60137 RepID=UPI0030ED3E47
MDTKDETISGLSLHHTLGADFVGLGATEPEDMLKYAELISDPNLTTEQKLEAASSLYELLTCIWGPETSGKPMGL